MSKTVKEDEETGGIVTTVRSETTKDLDVVARLKELNADNEEEEKKDDDDEQPAKEEPKLAKDPKKEGYDFEDLPPAAKAEMNRLYKEVRAGNKTIRQMESRMTELETKTADKAPAAAPVVQLQRPAKPDPAKFKTPEEFAKAEEKYEDELYSYRKKLETLENAERDAKARDAQIVASFNEKAEKFAEEHTDYEDVMNTAQPMSDVMFGMCLEEGPALAYHLVTNPEVADKIRKMPDKDQVKAMLRIVVKLEEAPVEAKPTADKKEPKTKKAEVVPAAGGRGATPVKKDPSQMTFKEREIARYLANPSAFSYDPREG